MPESGVRNPPWKWDEVVLACDLVQQNDWRGFSVTDPRVAELSGLLQILPLHPPDARRADFRNPNGVARKSFDIATAHPSYTGVPTHGGATDKAVIAAFLERPAEMRAEAQALRASALRGEFAGLAGALEDEEDDMAGSEGRLLIRRHVARERDPRLRRRKIDAARRDNHRLVCDVCGFNFEDVYGDRGRGYIECHHIVPLHMTGARSTRLDDLALLCANCHRMIHARAPWPTPAELQDLIARRAAATSLVH